MIPRFACQPCLSDACIDQFPVTFSTLCALLFISLLCSALLNLPKRLIDWISVDQSFHVSYYLFGQSVTLARCHGTVCLSTHFRWPSLCSLHTVRSSGDSAMAENDDTCVTGLEMLVSGLSFPTILSPSTES